MGYALIREDPAERADRLYEQGEDLMRRVLAGETVDLNLSPEALIDLVFQQEDAQAAFLLHVANGSSALAVIGRKALDGLVTKHMAGSI